MSQVQISEEPQVSEHYHRAQISLHHTADEPMKLVRMKIRIMVATELE
jgi:hypothetical protein